MARCSGTSDLLDTDISSAHIQRPGGIAHRFVQHLPRSCCYRGVTKADSTIALMPGRYGWGEGGPRFDEQPQLLRQCPGGTIGVI